LKAAVNINSNNNIVTTASNLYDRDSLLERKVGLATEGLAPV